MVVRFLGGSPGRRFVRSRGESPESLILAERASGRSRGFGRNVGPCGVESCGPDHGRTPMLWGDLERGRSVDPSGSNDIRWSYSRVTPGTADMASRCGNVSHYSSTVEQPWATGERRGFDSPCKRTSPCGASESLGKAEHVIGLNPGGGKRSLIPSSPPGGD